MMDQLEERKEIATVINGVLGRITSEIKFLEKLRNCIPDGHDWKTSTSREDGLPEKRDCTRCGATQLSGLKWNEPVEWGATYWDDLESLD